MRFVAAALAMIVAQPALAQDNGRTSRDDGITVTGQHISPQQARKIVSRLSNPVDGQFARFLEPICPAVIGFDAQHNFYVERRMRAFAKEMGLPLQDENCHGNLIVVITDNADATVERWHRAGSPLFKGVREEAIAAAIAPGPVHSWSATLVLNEDRQKIYDKGRGHKMESCGAQCTVINASLDVRSASILQKPTQWAYLSSIVVIDSEAALGKTLKQIADYASMRMLTGARSLSAEDTPSSILTLFDSAGAPGGATSLDRSFLKGLYKSPARAGSLTAAAMIARQIVDDSETNASD